MHGLDMSEKVRHGFLCLLLKYHCRFVYQIYILSKSHTSTAGMLPLSLPLLAGLVPNDTLLGKTDHTTLFAWHRGLIWSLGSACFRGSGCVWKINLVLLETSLMYSLKAFNVKAQKAYRTNPTFM